MPDEREEVVQKLVAEWVRWAHADMSVASLVDDERIAPEIVAFHAQQAVEKMLKALLVQRQVDFPRTHSIGALLSLCEEAGFVGAQEYVDASSLTRYAVATRYPGEEEPVSREEAKEAVTLAAQVFVWAFAELQASGDGMTAQSGGR
jgi:HEPN domain-containing protein